MQFSIRSYNLKEGRERTGHVGVRAPNEHSLHFSKLGGQFMHRDLAVPPSRGNDTLWQQGDSDARGHTARSEEHTSELQSRLHLVCRLLLEKKKKQQSPLILYTKKNNKQ